MKTAHTLLLVATCFMLIECSVKDSFDLDETYPGDEKVVWVSKIFSGGMQCTDVKYNPPDTKELLNNQGIAVFDTKIEHRPVCEACSCPGYAAKHFAQIKITDVEKAEELGFSKDTD